MYQALKLCEDSGLKNYEEEKYESDISELNVPSKHMNHYCWKYKYRFRGAVVIFINHHFSTVTTNNDLISHSFIISAFRAAACAVPVVLSVL